MMKWITIKPVAYINEFGYSEIWPEGVSFNHNSKCYEYMVDTRIINNSDYVKQL